MGSSHHPLTPRYDICSPRYEKFSSSLNLPLQFESELTIVSAMEGASIDRSSWSLDDRSSLDKKMISSRLELETFSVLRRCDNLLHYETAQQKTEIDISWMCRRILQVEILGRANDRRPITSILFSFVSSSVKCRPLAAQ